MESLVQQCQFYILMHLEEFPVDYLSLFPLSTRKALLWQLPLADVCQLLDTKFTEGLEADVVDCLLSRCDIIVSIADGDGDVERYVENRWKNNDMAYAREILYGQLVTCLLGCSCESFSSFELPNGDYAPLCFYDAGYHDGITNFLCGTRKKYQSRPMSAYSFAVPPRHLTDIGDDYPDLLSALEQLVRYFNDRLPKVLGRVCIGPRRDFYLMNDDDVVTELQIFREVELLCFEFEYMHKEFEPRATEFISTTVMNAQNLEVLVLIGREGPQDAPICIDTLCNKLTVCATFWSTLRIFKILSRPAYYEDSDCETSVEYVISRGTFDKLIKAYLTAPTDHEQLVQFTGTKIEGESSDSSSANYSDTTYLKFKTIRLVNCRFVRSFKATPETIANWLGREVDVLENEPESCSFQVKDSSGKRGQKRKFSEE